MQFAWRFSYEPHMEEIIRFGLTGSKNVLSLLCFDMARKPVEWNPGNLHIQSHTHTHSVIK